MRSTKNNEEKNQGTKTSQKNCWRAKISKKIVQELNPVKKINGLKMNFIKRWTKNTIYPKI